jgi:hypothetical protein
MEDVPMAGAGEHCRQEDEPHDGSENCRFAHAMNQANDVSESSQPDSLALIGQMPFHAEQRRMDHRS